MLELVSTNRIEQIGGMAVGALPLTDAIIAAAYRHGVDLTGFFVRKETKAHGLQQKVEGAFRKERRTAVLDDTITTGGSTLDALAAVRAAGAAVTCGARAGRPQRRRPRGLRARGAELRLDILRRRNPRRGARRMNPHCISETARAIFCASP